MKLDKTTLWVILIFALGLSAAIFMQKNESHDDSHHDHNHHTHEHHDHDHHNHGHHHVAPHGGCLVVFGNEFAHLELVVDSKTGLAKAYILNGEATLGVPISQKTIELNIKITSTEFKLSLKAQPNPLSGESIGNTSHFSTQDERLVNTSQFNVTINQIDIKGQRFSQVSFPYPEGNEQH